MLLDLRVKLRNRQSRIAGCGYDEFFPLSKQFFEFLKGNVVLASLVSELTARNSEVIAEATTAEPRAYVYGETSQQAAAIAYTKWHNYASQGDPLEFYNHVRVSGGFDAGVAKYRDLYIEPLFDYLDETLDDSNTILATLIRYKRKVEWYRREELQILFEAQSFRGEKALAMHMYEYLFDQGIPFHAEPLTGSGRPDVISLEDSDRPFIGDVKVFDAGGRGAAYLKKGLFQVYRYCWDYSQPIGHLIVFSTTNKQIRFELSSGMDGVPRFEFNHKTIFVTVIDIHAHEGTASTRGIPETVTIPTDGLVREFENETLPGQQE